MPYLAAGWRAAGTCSSASSDYIRERVLGAGFPERRVVRHYIGIDTEALRPATAPAARKSIVHVARLVEKKGTRYLIEAFTRVAKNDPEVELLIIGDGPLGRSLEALARLQGPGDRIRFLGTQANAVVFDRLSKAAVFCLPSVTARSGDLEGLPISILEAAAMAVPVVATLHSGIPEAVSDGESGYLVPERDVGALAERLAHLLANDGLRQEMGQAARRIVEERFDLQRQTAALEDLYESLL
jgi:colanic acid/amylovoran biosynthesis glycosyltransferase